MPYALQYTTLTNKYVNFPALNIASGETFSIECVVSIDATGAVRLVSSPSTVYTGRIWLQQSATPNVRITTSDLGVTADWNYSFVIGTFYKIKITRVGSTGELFINDVSQGTRTLNGSFQFDRFFSQHTTFGSSCTVRYIEFVSSAGTRLYRNDSGTGSIWPDVNNSANNATQQGTWAANDSEWVPYSSGGSGAELQATATGVSTATAALTTAVRLAAAAVGVSAATASLTTGIPLQAFGAGVSTATAQLSTQVRLNASALGVSSATASLITSIRLAASALGQSSATANLTTGGGGLSANAVGQSTATATMTTAIRLTASAVAQATATATLAGTSAQLAAAAVGVSTATAALSTSIRLQASAVALASSTAQLTTQIRLSAAGYSVSVATAELTIGQVLPPEVDAYKMKMTRITGNYKLQQQVSFSIINATPKFKIGRA